MFYFADFQIDRVLKVDSLDRQDDASRWLVVTVTPWLKLYFALLSPETDWLGKIISALTGSATYHVAIWLGDDAPANVLSFLESRVGLPYDLRGALMAWKEPPVDQQGYHMTGKEFCSGLAGETAVLVLDGVPQYRNPGSLLTAICRLLGKAIPKLRRDRATR